MDSGSSQRRLSKLQTHLASQGAETHQGSGGIQREKTRGKSQKYDFIVVGAGRCGISC